MKIEEGDLGVTGLFTAALFSNYLILEMKPVSLNIEIDGLVMAYNSFVVFYMVVGVLIIIFG